MDTGEVDFHVYAVSRMASILNPVIRIGFWLLRRHERAAFLDSTDRRMAEFTKLALAENRGPRIAQASAALTARHLAADDPVHAELARKVDRDGGASS